jgi:hypothetical protein
MKSSILGVIPWSFDVGVDLNLELAVFRGW